ncbi:MAG TPA: GNAT family N-acetyltransferase [Thermoanaerobaculia bacterium]
MDFTVRALSADDAAAIVALLRAQPPDYLRFFYALPADESAVRNVMEQRQRDLYQGLFEGDRLVGFFMLRGWDAGYDIPSFGIVVDQRTSGKGYLHATLELAAGLCRDAGAKRFMAKIHPENLAPRAARRLQLTQVGVEASTGNVIYHREV